jgi:indole-3-glycerol phosphate synthase
MLKNSWERHSLSEALRGDERLSFIFEIKKKSPSLGEMNARINPAQWAKLYEKHHAAAVSVLTEEKHFAGSTDDLVDVSEAVELPVLRKDFIVDKLQLTETLAYRADAVLLIVKLLGDRIGEYIKDCGALGIEPLVEVHNEEELTMALDSDAAIIGINNRDLDTLEIDLNTTARLLPEIPADRLVVSESGISSAKEVDMMRVLGVDAVLIGSALSRAESLETKLEELVECRRR